MPQIKMHNLFVKPDDRTATILEHTGPAGAPLMGGKDEGKGDTDYLCGGCGTIILQTVRTGLFQPGVVFKCSSCGVYSEM